MNYHIGNDHNINKLNNIFLNLKLDNVSAKDVHNTGIYTSKQELIDTFKSSERIKNSLSKDSHLFVRKVYDRLDENIEIRTFIYNGKLTALSCADEVKDKTEIIKKVKTFVSNIFLPYNDVVIDILYPDLKIIECNSFGADMPCGSGLFNWSEDYFTLHGFNDDIKFRSKDKYEH